MVTKAGDGGWVLDRSYFSFIANKIGELKKSYVLWAIYFDIFSVFFYIA